MNSKKSLYKPLCLCIVILMIGLNVSAQKSKHYLKKIKNQADFSVLQSNPAVAKYSNVQSVKVVYDFKKKRLYYINGNKYEFHHNFCYEVLKDKRSLPSFNRKNYNDKDRRFGLVNINYFKEKNIYSLEYNVSDDISFDNINFIYSKIKQTFYDSIGIVLNNNKRLSWKDDFTKKSIPIYLPVDLFGSQKLQIVNKGKANGELVFITKKEQLFNQNLTGKILVLKIDILEVPNCSGIITKLFQTPLSHISLLSKNRGIPVVAYPKVFSDDNIKMLEGKFCCLNVKDDAYTLRNCKKEKSSIQNRKRIIISSNLEEKRLKKITRLNLKDKLAYGTKVVNLAELGRVSDRKYNTPEGGFGIPFYYYKQHLSNNKIYKKITKFLADTSWVKDRKRLKKKLKKIRNAITHSPFDSLLMSNILTKIDTSKTGIKYRFRSSSNAEDLNGFNGAGLYTSKTGIIDNDDKSIEEAIKKVWASVWTLRAFEERQIFNIDQESVLMGVLVHRSFPNDYMNGVGITKNLYRDYNAGFVLNQQIGEHRVVDNQEHLPEQLISYYNSKADFFNQKDAVEYIATSELNNNKPILTSKEVFVLTKELERIKRHFYKKLKGKSYRKFALDIEYKYADDLTGKKKLYIKQVRLLSKD